MSMLQDIKKMIQADISESSVEWYKCLPKVKRAWNTTPSTSTNKSPEEIIMGRKPRLQLDKKILDIIRNNRAVQKKHYNKNKTDRKLYPGQLVLIRNRSKGILDTEFIGPAVVLNYGKRGTYKIFWRDKTYKLNIQDIKNWPCNKDISNSIPSTDDTSKISHDAIKPYSNTDLPKGSHEIQYDDYTEDTIYEWLESIHEYVKYLMLYHY